LRSYVPVVARLPARPKPASRAAMDSRDRHDALIGLSVVVALLGALLLRVSLVVYGHLARGADDYERELLDAFDAGRSGANGRYLGAEIEEEEMS
jgi:hypothetical protein